MIAMFLTAPSSPSTSILAATASTSTIHAATAAADYCINSKDL